MENPQYTKEQVPHVLNWQIAYAARELRHKKKVTLSCLKGDTNLILEQLCSFSNSSPVRTKTFSKPNSKEVLMEIFQTI